MRVLVACEFSGKVREAFRKLGHDAWSCDLLPSDDNSPYHLIGDVRGLLNDEMIWLGYFKDLGEAIEAREKGELEYYGQNYAN